MLELYISLIFAILSDLLFQAWNSKVLPRGVQKVSFLLHLSSYFTEGRLGSIPNSNAGHHQPASETPFQGRFAGMIFGGGDLTSCPPSGFALNFYTMVQLDTLYHFFKNKLALMFKRTNFYHMTSRLGVKERHAIKSVNH